MEEVCRPCHPESGKYYRTSDGVLEQVVERLVGEENSSDSEEILLGDDENDNND